MLHDVSKGLLCLVGKGLLFGGVNVLAYVTALRHRSSDLLTKLALSHNSPCATDLST